MNLELPGFDEFFTGKTDAEKLQQFSLARVIAVNKNSFLITDGSNEIFAELTGKFLFDASSPLDYPVTGDFVYARVFNEESFAVIDGLLPRKSLLKRKMPGKKVDFQLIASNIDTAIVVQGLDGDYNLRRLERYLVLIREGNIKPLLLLSKSDLMSKSEIEMRVDEIRRLVPELEVVSYSSLIKDDLEKVRELFTPKETYCLIGSSGVGKTTLLNSLLNKEAFSTQPVREKDHRGRHTTTRRELIVLDNGAMIIDTPGMRELGLMSDADAVDESFSDIYSLALNCRFRDCTHTREEGCALLEAIKKGELSPERFNSYIKLMKESRFYQMSYLEKRKKDKEFGKMVKSVLKNHPKK
ncbi:MAG TPA: ribosome small subunit-dependent GTPase A [Ignavibacteriales bacterium]|nr:ribosome small subunit-dependent GTPase A [Ignavibacteriales bacterium]